MRRSFAAIVCILLSLSAAAKTENSNDYSVTVNTVEVWVKVQSARQDVRHLTQSDFQIYEDDKRMNLTCFNEQEAAVDTPSVETTPSSPQTQAAAIPKAVSEKKVVLFLDLFNTSEAEFGFIKPKISDFLDQVEVNHWQVLLAAFLPNKKLGVAVPFTRRTLQIHDAIDRFAANPGRDLPVVSNQRELSRILDAGVKGPGLDQLIDAYARAQQYAKEDRERTLFSLDALQGFGTYLQKLDLPDHIVMVFISGGFDSDPGRRYFDIVDKFADQHGFDTLSTSAAQNIPDSVRPNNFDIFSEIHKRIGLLNKSNITLYSINTRGIYMSGHDAAAESLDFSSEDTTLQQDMQASLSAIAQDTGGLTFENSSNFGKGFDAILNDLQHDYLLCYSAPSHDKRGAYHKIKVTGPKGYDLRYRKGYID